jgi:multiple sugar transport system substrate-binding protein
MNLFMPSAFRNAMLRALCLFALASAIAASGCPAGETPGDVFSWRQASGQTLRILLNKHPYAEGIRRRIPAFEQLTGIRVAYSMHPESVYFEALETSFDGGASARPDVYMTGVYQIWEYAVKGRAAPLDKYIQNPAATRQGYDVNDFFPAISGAFRWNRKAGSPAGEGPLWAIPMGFESFALTYNREVLARNRLAVPRTMEELVATGRQLEGFEGPGTYGVTVRGRAEWGSVHSGYITAFVNYGAKDMEIENGRLVSRVNSPEAVAVTDLWATMLRDCGPEDWDQYDWTRCLEDFGARRAAILFDADILGYFADFPGATSQSGKLALAPPPAPEGTPPEQVRSNLWVWGLAMNPASENDAAAWLFIQYFTGREFQAYSVLEWQSVNPPRRSVFENPEFRKVVSRMPGFVETFSSVIDNTAICFTPTPIFFDISRRWATVVRDIAKGVYPSTQAGMDALKEWMDGKLATVSVD